MELGRLQDCLRLIAGKMTTEDGHTIESKVEERKKCRQALVEDIRKVLQMDMKDIDEVLEDETSSQMCEDDNAMNVIDNMSDKTLREILVESSCEDKFEMNVKELIKQHLSATEAAMTDAAAKIKLLGTSDKMQAEKIVDDALTEQEKSAQTLGKMMVWMKCSSEDEKLAMMAIRIKDSAKQVKEPLRTDRESLQDIAEEEGKWICVSGADDMHKDMQDLDDEIEEIEIEQNQVKGRELNLKRKQKKSQLSKDEIEELDKMPERQEQLAKSQKDKERRKRKMKRDVEEIERKFFPEKVTTKNNEV